MLNFSLKRRREDGLLVDDTQSHDKKKPRPLILRPHQDPGQNLLFRPNNQFALQSHPPTLTPIESSDDDDDAANLCNNPMGTTHVVQESLRKTHSLPSGDNLSPWPVTAGSNGSVQPSPIPHDLVNQSLNITTPVCGTFPVNSQSASAMETEPLQHMEPLVSSSADAERSHDSAWWHRRRLPSPISEDEGSPSKSSKASISDAEMACTTSQPVSPPTHHIIDPIQQHEAPFINYPGKAKLPRCPSNSSPAKRKVMFSMGYRADCEKCRNKVPGHYSHIIRA